MVKDTIYYAGEAILTIYHKGFDKEIGNRRIKKTEKIGRYNIIFEEKVVEENVLDSLADWDLKIEGLLGTKDIRNPYGDGVCAYMVRYLNLDKPKKLFTSKEEEYRLNIPIKYFNQIVLFTKKYTGLDLHQQAMCYGDIFVYECYQRDITAKEDEGIIIDVYPGDSRIIVNFRNDDIIVCAKTIEIQEKESKKIEVICDSEWNSCDIQIYQGSNLVFLRDNLSFMRTMVLNQEIKGRSERVQLNKLGKALDFQSKGYVSESIIGKKQDEVKTLISKSNYSIKKRLEEENDRDNGILFISPNELEIARDYIVNILRSASDEIWIFDPYFSDRNGMMISLDWIKILSYCTAATKHVVFWNNESRYPISVNEFVSVSLEDTNIKDLKENKHSLGIWFYQIKTYIHDRFIFACSEDKVVGITVGTSLNSLDSNYYCIHELSNSSARNILSNLKELTSESNIVAQANI